MNHGVFLWRHACSTFEESSEETLCGEIEDSADLTNFAFFLAHEIDGQSYDILCNPFTIVLSAIRLCDGGEILGRYAKLVCIELHLAFTIGIEVEQVDELTVYVFLTRYGFPLIWVSMSNAFNRNIMMRLQ